MDYRILGKTGVRVSAIGLGGAHAAKPDDPAESVRMIRKAIDSGITFMDNCWDYSGGDAEVRMGKALRDGYRQRVVLMTKIDAHLAAAATAQIEQCLQHLQTDYLDVLQIHEVIRPDDPDRAFAPGGTMEALLAARQAGKIRNIGFTGHKDPAIHLKMLNMGFDWDTVQMPLNCVDAHHLSFEARVLPVLVERGIGVLGMKPLAAGEAVRSGAATAEECLRYAMSLPTSVVITGCDSMPIVEQAIRVWQDFKPMTAEEMAALRRRTAAHSAGGALEGYKTSGRFDGTVKNPHWLTTASVSA
ncbi:MAG TPA: aldo/keto reductase [Chloroflexota bacterium]|jgi:predicted aldo/keto reductase-like oxidoreductase|nr:aldo/keto reductase [Chloroflexota bacterium]